jgi:hypothetical protein
MSKFRTIALTALVCLPIGVVIAGPMKGHPNLEKARSALNEADTFISKSQAANEHVWKDEGGHGQRAKEAIATAKHELELAAEWVNSHEK